MVSVLLHRLSVGGGNIAMQQQKKGIRKVQANKALNCKNQFSKCFIKKEMQLIHFLDLKDT